MSKKGGTEARAAMSELISELDRTRKEYAKSTLQLTQLETQTQYLKDAELKKDQVISHLENQLEVQDQQHRQEVEVLQEEFRVKDTAWAHRVKQLELEVKRLEQENEAMTLFEKENRQLRDTVMENQAVIERLQLINDDLKSRTNDDAHEQIASLEQEFKRRLADAEKKFRAEAYRALSEEAKIALQGNDHLQTVLQRQNDSIEAVLLRCKQLEQAHAKVQQEQEFSTSNLNHHMTEIQRLKKQLGDSRVKNNQLEDALKQRKVERASLELLFIEYETTRKQLAKANEKCRRALREAERWRNRAVQLTHELGEDEREAAEAKILATQTQSDRIESHITRRKNRSEKRDKEKQRIQDGAVNFRMTEFDEQEGEEDAKWSDVSEDDVTREDIAKHRTINPMDILAMWNVNFETHKPLPAEALSETGSDEKEESGLPKVHAPQPPGSPQVPEALQLATSVDFKMEAELSPTGTRQSKVSGSIGRVRPVGKRIEEARQEMDRHLSVLSQPKSSTSAPASRHFSNLAAKVKAPNVTLSNELSVVSQGEFKLQKRNTGGNKQRFLVP